MRCNAATRIAIAAVVAAAACGGRSEPHHALRMSPTPTGNSSAAVLVADLALTPNQFLSAGPPTIIIGTLGDDAADRSVAAQAELVGALIPGTTLVTDTAFNFAAGPSAWPARPVLYGNADVNAVVAKLGVQLPLAIDRHQLTVGDAVLTGLGDRIIAVVPGRAAAYPTFLLYAGTGMPGIVDINALSHGGEPILLGDGFGRLRSGRWQITEDGNLTAKLDAAKRRIDWRRVERMLGGVTLAVAFPEQLAAADDEALVVDAVVRGLQTASKKLGISAKSGITVYVSPDRRSKVSLTGDSGDGHAVAIAGVLHVVRFDPSPGGPLESLVAHEGTHLLAGMEWGSAATPLLGEGLAVWVAGTYGGTPLADHARAAVTWPAPSTLLTPQAFRSAPEQISYPVAGSLVTAAIAKVGLPAVRSFLFGASAKGWAAACIAAGTTADELDAAVAAMHAAQ